VPLPFWARNAIRREAWSFNRPSCLLVARTHHPQLSLYLVPWRWQLVSFLVDGTELGWLPKEPYMRLTVAIGLQGRVRHVFGIEPRRYPDMIEPVTLKLRRGTIVLLEVWPQTRLLAGRRSPKVTYRILPAGLTRNGRWGERWARRLGWEDGGG